MRKSLVLVLALAAAGCSTLDKAATGQNLANVTEIAAENSGFWDASGKPPSLVNAAKLRNAAAVELAKSMNDEAK